MDLNGEKPFIFLNNNQISKVEKQLMYQHYRKFSSTYLLNSTSVPPIHIALLRTTFYKVFPFFPRYAVHSIVLPESNMIHLIRLFMTFNRKYAICVELSRIEFHLAVMKQNTLYNKFSSKTISKKQKNYS